MDRLGTRRPARGRPPHDPPRRREAALARLSGRGGARASPAATGSAPAANCRRSCSTTPRRSRSRSACAPPRRGRSPGSRRRRSGRWPSSSRSCPAGCGAGSARSATRPRRSASRGRRSTPTCWRRSPGRAGIASRIRFGYVARDDSASQRNIEPSASSTAATAGTWWRSISIATTGARSASTGFAGRIRLGGARTAPNRSRRRPGGVRQASGCAASGTAMRSVEPGRSPHARRGPRMR